MSTAIQTAPRFSSLSNRIMVWVVEWVQHCANCDVCAGFNSFAHDCRPCGRGQAIWQKLSQMVRVA